jgi:hypothetical protein
MGQGISNKNQKITMIFQNIGWQDGWKCRPFDELGQYRELISPDIIFRDKNCLKLIT